MAEVFDQSIPFQDDWSQLAKNIKAREEKCEQFEASKAALDVNLKQVIDALDQMKLNIERNIYSKLNPNGFLTAKLSEYLSCFMIDIDKLKQLYAQDKEFWTSFLKDANAQASQAKADCKEILSKLCVTKDIDDTG